MTFVLRVRLTESPSEVEVPFANLDELKEKLTSLDFEALSEVLRTTVGHSMAAETKAPRPELEGIATLGPGGTPRFSKVPSAKVEYVGMLLFAVEPKRLESREIERITGIERVASNYLSQPSFKRYFTKDAEARYTLSVEGKRWITQDVLTKLK